MLREGTGLVAPAPVSIKLSRGDAAMLQRFAHERDNYRQYTQRRDRWGKGLIGGATFFGYCGEHALCVFLNRKLRTRLAVDTVPRRRGDGGLDVVVCGLGLQVKTSVTSALNLIRRFDAAAGIRPLKSDVYVFARWHGESLTVDLLGWAPRRDVLAFSVRQKSERAPHHNLVVPHDRLRPMAQLLDKLSPRGPQ